MAFNCITVTREENVTISDFCYGLFLYAGLWYDDDSSCNRNPPNSVDFLFNAEAVCRRYDRICERIAENYN